MIKTTSTIACCHGNNAAVFLINPGWYDLWNTGLWYDLGKNRPPPLAEVVLPAIAFLRNFERVKGQQDQEDW